MYMTETIRKLWKKIFSNKFSPGLGTKKLLWGGLFFLVIALILTLDLIPNRIDLEIGQVSKTDIAAPRTLTFIDQEKTQELKKMASESAPKVYEEDKNVNNNVKRDISSLFSAIKNKKTEDKKSESKKTYNQLVSELQSELDPGLKKSTITTLIKTKLDFLNEIEKKALQIMDEQLKQRILPGDLAEVKKNIERLSMELDIDKEYRLAISDILQSTVMPNMILNSDETQKRKEEAVKSVQPVKRHVRQGEIILRKGDVVTKEDIKVLEALGLQKPRINYLNILGILLIILTLIVLFSFYLYQYEPETWNNNNKLILIELLTVVVVLLAKITTIFQSEYFIYLVPVAVASVLITILIGSRIALIVTIFLSFIVGLMFNSPFNAAVVGFVGGLVGIFSVSKVSQRSDLVRAGFNVSGVLVFMILGLTLTDAMRSWVVILRAIGMGVLNGVLVAILANGLLPYLENVFGLTSSVKLLELSNPSQPLLKRLLVEAPGTYHHSVIVGNLVETAADNIGADSLLARVGAYYHDIGKLKRPYFFNENQFGAENPHDKVSANLSSLIIKSHVKDGVEMAKKYKLPEVIMNIIEQHHGTNLISYFYQQAVEDSKHGSVEESEFRYDGPKPQSREAAIMMLSDIVEAAVRSKNFNKNNISRIEGFVRDLIRDKLNENQLDESDLTLNDLDTIANSFVKVLTGIYHQRIEYPENLLKEMKRADKSDKS